MTHQETSRAAWRDFVKPGATLDRAILEALSAAGARGLTCQEIEKAIGRNHQAVSGNLRHLVERGLVEGGNGHMRGVDSGRQAIVWTVNLMGPERVITPSPRRNKLREAVESALKNLDRFDGGLGTVIFVDQARADLKKALGR